jgi:hypothetical protein
MFSHLEEGVCVRGKCIHNDDGNDAALHSFSRTSKSHKNFSNQNWLSHNLMTKHEVKFEMQESILASILADIPFHVKFIQLTDCNGCQVRGQNVEMKYLFCITFAFRKALARAAEEFAWIFNFHNSNLAHFRELFLCKHKIQYLSLSFQCLQHFKDIRKSSWALMWKAQRTPQSFAIDISWKAILTDEMNSFQSASGLSEFN